MTEQLQNVVAIWTPGPLELIIILIIAVLLFGRRLPEIARGLGKSLTEFKKGVRETQDKIQKAADIDDVMDSTDTNTTSGDKDPEDVLRP